MPDDLESVIRLRVAREIDIFMGVEGLSSREMADRVNKKPHLPGSQSGPSEKAAISYKAIEALLSGKRKTQHKTLQLLKNFLVLERGFPTIERYSNEEAHFSPVFDIPPFTRDALRQSRQQFRPGRWLERIEKFAAGTYSLDRPQNWFAFDFILEAVPKLGLLVRGVFRWANAERKPMTRFVFGHATISETHLNLFMTDGYSQTHYVIKIEIDVMPSAGLRDETPLTFRQDVEYLFDIENVTKNIIDIIDIFDLNPAFYWGEKTQVLHAPELIGSWNSSILEWNVEQICRDIFGGGKIAETASWHAFQKSKAEAIRIGGTRYCKDWLFCYYCDNIDECTTKIYLTE